MLQFFVIQHGGEWIIKTATQPAGHYRDRVNAIAAAITLAGTEGKAWL